MSISESADYEELAEFFASHYPEQEQRRMKQVFAIAAQGALGVLLNRIAKLQVVDGPSDYFGQMSAEFERSMTELLKLQEKNSPRGMGNA